MAVPPSYGRVPIRNKPSYAYLPVSGHATAPGRAPLAGVHGASHPSTIEHVAGHVQAPAVHVTPPSYRAPGVIAPTYHGPVGHPSPAPAHVPPGALNIRAPIQQFHPEGKWRAEAGHLVQRALEANQRIPGNRIATPHIPIISGASPQTIQAALSESARIQNQHFRGQVPTRAAELAFHSALMGDPRNAQFVQATAHYLREANRLGGLRSSFQARVKGPTGEEGPGANVIDAAVKASQPLAAAHVQLAREGQRSYEREQAALERERTREEQRAERAPTPGRVSPKIGIVTPPSPISGLPGLAATGTAVRTLGLGALAAGATVPAGANKGPLGSTASELTQIAEWPYVAGFSLGKAGVEAATQGSLAPLGHLASSFGKAVSQGAVGQAVQGNWQGAAKAASEHRVMTALELAGLTSAAGRAAGAFARSPLLGPKPTVGPSIRSRIAPSIAYERDVGAAQAPAGRFQQRYSGDITRQLAQMALHRRAEKITQPETGRPLTVSERGGIQMPVLAPRRGREGRPGQEATLQQKLAHHIGAGAQAMEFQARERVNKRLTAIERRHARVPIPEVRGKDARALVHLVVSGTIKSPASFMADLRKEYEKTRGALGEHERAVAAGRESAYGTKEDLATAQENAAMLKRALSNPNVEAQRQLIVEQGRRIAEYLNEADRERVALGLQPFGEAERAKLTEYAIAHMDARWYTKAEHQAAEEAVLARGGSQAEADAVGGRSPEALAAYHLHAEQGAHSAQELKDARAELRASREAKAVGPLKSDQTKAAERELLKAEHGRQRILGRQASRRAREGGAASSAERKVLAGATTRVSEAKTALREAKATDQREQKPALEARVSSAKQRLRAAEAEHRLVRADREAHPLPPREENLRGPEGHQLTNAEIRAHARANGVEPDALAYAPHLIRTGSKRAFHKRFRPGSRPTTARFQRTGALQARGARAIGQDVLHQEAANKATAINLARAHDRIVREYGRRKPDGQMWNPKEANEAVDLLRKEGRGEWTPIRAYSTRNPVGVLAKISEAQQPQAALESAHQGIFRESRIDPGDTSTAGRNVVLVPSHLLEELEKLASPSNEGERFFQMLVGPFRRAVLPQPRWLAGNFIEPYFVRLPLSGAGINLPGLGMDVIAAKRVLASLKRSGDPRAKEAFRMIEAQQTRPGLFVGKQRAASTYRRAEDFTGRTASVVRAVERVGSIPAIHQVAWLVVKLTNGFFNINRAIETSAQYQAFGKSARRDIQDFTGSWFQSLRLGQRAVDEVARGLTDTPTQHRFMTEQHELLGKYDGWSPKMKWLVRTYAPFLPWTLAALRFVYWTLPAHHTVAFTGLMKLAQGVIKEWEAEHEEVKQANITGTLRDALKTEPGHYIDIARYTPYGATIPAARYGDLANLFSQFVPQASGATEAFSGRDPFGRTGQVPKTEATPKGEPTGAQKVRGGLAQFLESLVPGASTAKRLLEGGGTPYFTSDLASEIQRRIEGKGPLIKPGSVHGEAAWERTFNPFRATVLKASGGKAGAATTPAQELREARQALRESRGAVGATQAELREAREVLRKQR